MTKAKPLLCAAQTLKSSPLGSRFLDQEIEAVAPATVF